MSIFDAPSSLVMNTPNCTGCRLKPYRSLPSVHGDSVDVESVPYPDDIKRRHCTWGQGDEKIPESVFGAPRDLGK